MASVMSVSFARQLSDTDPRQLSCTLKSVTQTMGKAASAALSPLCSTQGILPLPLLLAYSSPLSPFRGGSIPKKYAVTYLCSSAAPYISATFTGYSASIPKILAGLANFITVYFTTYQGS